MVRSDSGQRPDRYGVEHDGIFLVTEEMFNWLPKGFGIVGLREGYDNLDFAKAQMAPIARGSLL